MIMICAQFMIMIMNDFSRDNIRMISLNKYLQWFIIIFEKGKICELFFPKTEKFPSHI